jgi:hypothetical protein
LGVVADGVDANVFFLEQREVVLQLDQLRAAKRSPHCGAKEDNNGFGVTAVGVEIDQLAVLIR